MEQKPNGKNNLTWHEAIIEVLKISGKAMHYTDIAAEILQRGLRKNVGATPAATVGANIYSSIKSEKENSPFLKTGNGEFILKEQSGSAVTSPTSASETLDEIKELKEDVGIIQALGMYWQRDLVEWQNNPQLLGRQLQKADSKTQADQVNFCDQRGVYLLHDWNEVIYVGRALERPLGKRLYEHTFDRLNGRWNRFSWFGLSQVKPDGTLIELEAEQITQKDIIITMEALLIEGLEPKQNRKRGDTDFKAIEYIQIEDPKIKERKKKEILAELISGAQLAK
jgi:hypothetical protein